MNNNYKQKNGGKTQKTMEQFILETVILLTLHIFIAAMQWEPVCEERQLYFPLFCFIRIGRDVVFECT